MQMRGAPAEGGISSARDSPQRWGVGGRRQKAEGRKQDGRRNKTCLQQPDEHLLRFASFEFNSFSPQRRRGREKTNQNKAFSFSSLALRSIRRCPAALPLRAGRLQGLGLGGRLANEPPPPSSPRSNDHTRATADEKGRVVRMHSKVWQGTDKGGVGGEGTRALMGCSDCERRAQDEGFIGALVTSS